MKSTRSQIIIFFLLVGLIGVLLTQQQMLADWWHLRNYNVPTAVATLANDDTMTPKARHLFYVNHPVITASNSFTSHCPSGTEKTVVLGCYVGVDRGIYIYKVDDSRLNGVEEVTAAHETLHAAYRRLSRSERKKVNAMLINYYDHGLTDQRIKATIAAYKKSEPHDVINEMHSVFGTEIVNLPSSLETYYRQYFTKRSTIISYTVSYQGEFLNRQEQVKTYDTQLHTLKQQIDTNSDQIIAQKAALNAQNQALQVNQTNAQISAYNTAVTQYNNLVNTTKDLISQYNRVITERNSIVLEEQQLSQELSVSSLSK